MVKRALSFLFVMTLASGILVAQELKSAHTARSSHVIATQADPATLKTIYSNLGPTVTNNYNATTGYYVLGPTNSLALSEQWIALPFSPKANSHVTVLQAAIGYISGTQRVNLGLYSDNAGVVGTLLAQGHTTSMGAFGVCCQTANVHIASTAVTAGTQYWIVATSDDTNAPDFTAVFEASNQSNIGYNVALGGWFAFSGNVPAAAAKGTVP